MAVCDVVELAGDRHYRCLMPGVCRVIETGELLCVDHLTRGIAEGWNMAVERLQPVALDVLTKSYASLLLDLVT